MLSSEKPVLRARRSCPGLCPQAHFPSRFPASEDGQMEASRTGGESAGHLGRRSPRGTCEWPHDGAVVQETRGNARYQLRGPGTLAGRGPPATELPLEKDSTPSEQQGCRGRSPRPVPPERLSPPSSIRAGAQRPPPGAQRPAASPGLRSGQQAAASIAAARSPPALPPSPSAPPLPGQPVPARCSQHSLFFFSSN